MLELMLVVVITGILAALAAPLFGRMQVRLRLKAGVLMVKRQIQAAQGMAVRDKDRWGVYFNTGVSPQTSQIFHDVSPAPPAGPNNMYDAGDVLYSNAEKLPRSVSFFLPTINPIANSVVQSRPAFPSVVGLHHVLLHV